HRGARGGPGARAAVRRLRARRGGGHQPARRRRADPDRGGDRPSVRAVPGRPRRSRGHRLMPSSTAELVELLDIETLDTDLFRGNSPHTDRQRVFGRPVPAQALIAAIRTVDEGLEAHSLHAYFLRPGDTTVPIIYDGG